MLADIKILPTAKQRIKSYYIEKVKLGSTIEPLI